MSLTGHRSIRHPRPPGIDTLRCTARYGLDAVPDPQHRAMMAGLLDSGLLDGLIAFAVEYEPAVDRAATRVRAGRLAAEFAAFGIAVPAATIRTITVMRSLMVPVADEDLAFALDRVWVFGTYLDDLCSREPAEAEAVLREALLPERAPARPTTRYLRHLFAGIAPFCDPTFLAVYRAFLHNALIGVLMEAEFTPEVSDGVDSDFVRAYNGFSQFWFVSLQFTDPCLDARTNRAFWSASLCSGVTFLNDVNDVLSSYKEAVDGADFVSSRLYRSCVREGVAYRAVARRTLDSGLGARDRLLALASADQRPHLERYAAGYVCFHLRCRRYRWNDVYPGLTPIDT
ncbi:hypothetical protein [Streptomyces sp. NK15101]|uniref:hypothetical protein n=1 Tax=Streptomyces sp. NK15101 TaxID=2873261 RepID=UPI001CEDF3BD|nr:hypothetical protein [Streptomyces sp. NK15101]